MEHCLTEEIAALRRLSPQRVYFLLQSESKDHELTKSLLNLLHNIVVVQSLEPTLQQKLVFEEKEALVWQLLSPSTPISSKKRLLERNIDFVWAVAESCPV